MKKYIVIEKGDEGETKGPIWKDNSFKTWEIREDAIEWANKNLANFFIMKVIIHKEEQKCG